LQRRDKIRRKVEKRVELLMNIIRIATTMTKVDLNGENILMIDKIDKQ